MNKSVSAKMGLKAGSRALFVNAPADAIAAIEPPMLDVGAESEGDLEGDFEYIHLFVTRQAALHEEFPKLKAHVKPTGMLWVSWPKAGQMGTDLTLTKVIEIGYEYGLVESKNLRINAIWSALKFTHPKKGKVYRNSYGTLNL
ncbi:hypothetical protein [Spirosoma agri]|nr:hypothetical protein [Spirosoma agri]